MLHAEARERLADLALEPGRLARLDEDGSPEARALRDHLAGCRACTDDLAGWRRTWAQVGRAMAPAGRAADAGAAGVGEADDAVEAQPDTFRAPASLRARTLAAVAAEAGRGDRGVGRHPAVEAARRVDGAPVATPEATARRWRSLPWLAVAAALVIALGAGSLAWNRSAALDRATLENAGLADTAATLNRILATPTHWVVTLRAPDGTAGGTMAWTAAEIAVITTSVPGPTAGQSYRCWVERDGVRTPIGPMWFSGSTGYWAGPMGGWASGFIKGARLGVSLVPAGDGPPTPVLVGEI